MDNKTEAPASLIYVTIAMLLYSLVYLVYGLVSLFTNFGSFWILIIGIIPQIIIVLALLYLRGKYNNAIIKYGFFLGLVGLLPLVAFIIILIIAFTGLSAFPLG